MEDPDEPELFLASSFLIRLKALMAKAILPRNTALMAANAMIPRKRGIKAASLSFNRRRRGRIFLIFFFFLPRPKIRGKIKHYVRFKYDIKITILVALLKCTYKHNNFQCLLRLPFNNDTYILSIDLHSLTEARESLHSLQAKL